MMSFDGGCHSPLQHAAKILVMVAAGVGVGGAAYDRTDRQVISCTTVFYLLHLLNILTAQRGFLGRRKELNKLRWFRYY